jgi:2-polyprenyl-3-methyl-5-hydroxy-6-metoxy-1,4-benzoquinol methylase
MEILVTVVPDGATVFDIGCGAGLFLGLLASRITKGMGVDSSASAIGTARGMALAQNEMARLTFAVAGDISLWPVGQFSVVSLIDVLHHVAVDQQRALVLAAAARVAPGGMVLYKDIPPRPRWRAVMNRLHDLVMAGQWIHYRSGDEIAAWLSEAGLRIERRERHNRWWYAHEVLVARRVVS